MGFSVLCLLCLERLFIKGMLLLKALTCMKFFPVQTKIDILSRRRIPLAILIHKQFIHSTQIILSPNIIFFEHSAACLSVVFELLPGSIPLTIL